MTLEQKEQITAILSLIYIKINRGKQLAEVVENAEVNGTAQNLVVNDLAKEIGESLKSGERYLDKLKEYFMEIDDWRELK